MKKFIFGFIATVFIAVTSIGQTFPETAKKNAINAQMVTMVNVSKTFYVKGQTYNDFVKAMPFPSPTVPSQDEFLRKVYSYVSTGAADCDIMKGDNSVLSRFASELANVPKNMSTPNATYSAKKKWWQIAINAIFNLALDIIAPNDVTVDLFPDEITGAIKEN